MVCLIFPHTNIDRSPKHTGGIQSLRSSCLCTVIINRCNRYMSPLGFSFQSNMLSYTNINTSRGYLSWGSTMNQGYEHSNLLYFNIIKEDRKVSTSILISLSLSLSPNIHKWLISTSKYIFKPSSNTLMDFIIVDLWITTLIFDIYFISFDIWFDLHKNINIHQIIPNVILHRC